MGHRALVAVEQASGRYRVYYSHWGAANLRLKEPLQEWNAERDGESHDDAPPECDAEEWHEPPVDSLADVAHDVLDYSDHEALYVVPFTPADDVEAFRTFWVGRLRWEATDGETTAYHDGVLVGPRWYDGEPLGTRLIGKCEGYRAAMGEEIDGGRLSVEDAQERLEHYIYGLANRSGRGSKRNPPYIPRYSPRAALPPGVDGRIRGLDAHDKRADYNGR